MTDGQRRRVAGSRPCATTARRRSTPATPWAGSTRAATSAGAAPTQNTTDQAPQRSPDLETTGAPRNGTRYSRGVALQSFRDKDTAGVWQRRFVKRFGPELTRAAYRKLMMLDAAEVLTDVAVPPSNRLEPLTGDRAGQHSIRINDQYRVCFVWPPGGPRDVEIVDYH